MKISPRRLTQLFGLPLLALFFVSPVFAQAVGGEWQTPHRFHGHVPYATLGQSVSGAGDVNGDGYDDVILGAPRAPNFGMAVVCSGLDGSILHLLNPGDLGLVFGIAVSGVGDLDLDGFADFAVGSRGTATERGTLTVYSGLNASVLYQWVGENDWDWFGDSVGSAGDVDGDGVPDIVVGAPRAGFGISTSGGGAYLYSGADGTLIRVHRTFDFGGDEIDYFGDSVAGLGDVNQDGFDDIIIGSTFFGQGGMGTGQDGAAFVLSGLDGTLLHQVIGSLAFKKCGEDVSGVGDIDQDGYADFIVGGRNATVGNKQYCGAAEVYSGATGDLIYRFEGEAYYMMLGSSVAPAGDVDRDGVVDLLIGADHANANGIAESGEVRIYSGANGSLLHTFSGTKEHGYFGNAVASAGDIDGDGRAELLAASYYAEVGGDHAAGTVVLLDYLPYLTSSQQQIPAMAASNVELYLSFPEEAAHYSYRVLVSSTGIGPFEMGVKIPLTWDRQTHRSIRGLYAATHSTDMHGVLDLNAKATASFGAPTGFYSSAIGTTCYLAAVAFPQGGMPRYSSAVLRLEFVP